MERKIFNQVALITAENVDELEQKINSKMVELAASNPTLDIDIGELHATITFTKSESIPETTKDLFKLEGIMYLCENCPDLEMDGDGRKKRFCCKHAVYGTSRRDCEACDFFYKRVAAGELQPINI